MKNILLKIGFGLIIFSFSVALAYITARYLGLPQVPNGPILFDYYGTLLIFGGLYVFIGIMISSVYPVSLGFLLASDVVILHLAGKNFGTLDGIWKVVIIGSVLVFLYTAAWFKFIKNQPIESAPAPTAFNS